jgi:hypothetical protein
VDGPFLAFSEEAFALLLLYSEMFFVWKKNICFEKTTGLYLVRIIPSL